MSYSCTISQPYRKKGKVQMLLLLPLLVLSMLLQQILAPPLLPLADTVISITICGDGGAETTITTTTSAAAATALQLQLLLLLLPQQLPLLLVLLPLLLLLLLLLLSLLLLGVHNKESNLPKSAPGQYRLRAIEAPTTLHLQRPPSPTSLPASSSAAFVSLGNFLM